MILLTGSTGYLGSSYLQESKYKNDILTVGRDFSINHSRGQFVLGEDLMPSSRLEKTVLVNLAANTSKGNSANDLENLIEANIELTAKLAQRAETSGIDFMIHISTFSKYSEAGDFKPQTLYSATKAAGEDLLVYFANRKSVTFVVLDLFDVYGPGHHKNKIIPQAIQSFTTGDMFTIRSQGSQTIRPIYYSDVIRGIDYIIEHSKYLLEDGHLNRFSLPGPEETSVLELVQLIASFFPDGKFQITPDLKDPGIPNSISRAFSPNPLIPDFKCLTSLREGLRKTVESYFYES